MELAALEGGSEDAARPKEMFLSDHFVERARTHAVGQRSTHIGRRRACRRRLAEEVH
jgi:hypothetical protein